MYVLWSCVIALIVFDSDDGRKGRCWDFDVVTKKGNTLREVMVPKKPARVPQQLLLSTPHSLFKNRIARLGNAIDYMRFDVIRTSDRVSYQVFVDGDMYTEWEKLVASQVKQSAVTPKCWRRKSRSGPTWTEHITPAPVLVNVLLATLIKSKKSRSADT